MGKRKPEHVGRWAIGFGVGVAACLLVAAARPAPAPDGSRVSGRIVLPAEIRVGLATDLDRLEVPCCESRSWLVAEDGEKHEVDGRFSVRPAPGKATAGVHRLQVAALRDSWQAERLAVRLAGLLDQDAASVLDAATGLYRVRVGRYGEREQAEEARGRLRVEGFDDIWIAIEGAVLEDPGFVVDGIGWIAGRRLRLESDGAVVDVLGRRYRGALELFVNDRAGINVVNAAPLEDYVRGVVPGELGPDLYPEFEATKAQAVAVRTYAVRHRSEFAGEGYDICATPLCQVYGGLEAEHPRSDEAVAATRGEILVRSGEPLEALFTASCGGSTELMRNVFPRLAGEGPTGTACVEGGGVRLVGRAGGTPEQHLLKALGMAGVRARRPSERLARALSRGALQVVAGNLVGVDGRWLQLRKRGVRRLLPLAPEAELSIATATSGAPAADLGAPVDAVDMAPGDRVRAYLASGRVALVVHEAPSAGGQPAAVPWSVWRSHGELRESVERRFPGLGLVSMQVLERGVSGRIARLDLIGERRSVEVQGLAIRWLLDVPENLVRMTAETGAGDVAGWRFDGSGRGHGVGMCQIGSYLMAQRGLSYREILWHYYGAVDIGSFGS
ncbi:MAG: SpoIID/LytB domain-containing protein [Acidobacteria bacterium]|nr:SpoIID/LytB domain-containing protein [Acidobacteriota bacterium]